MTTILVLYIIVSLLVAAIALCVPPYHDGWRLKAVAFIAVFLLWVPSLPIVLYKSVREARRWKQKKAAEAEAMAHYYAELAKQREADSAKTTEQD